MPSRIRARIFARAEGRFAKLLLMSSCFAKLLEAIFSYFAKIIWMSSWDSKLFEMLLCHGNLTESGRRFVLVHCAMGNEWTQRETIISWLLVKKNFKSQFPTLIIWKRSRRVSSSWNFYHISLHKYSARSIYLMLIKLYKTLTDYGCVYFL